jgi:hypothetical protein
MSFSPRQITRHFRRARPGISMENRSGTSLLTRKISLAPASDIPIMVHATLRNRRPRTTRALERFGGRLSRFVAMADALYQRANRQLGRNAIGRYLEVQSEAMRGSLRKTAALPCRRFISNLDSKISRTV